VNKLSHSFSLDIQEKIIYKLLKYLLHNIMFLSVEMCYNKHLFILINEKKETNQVVDGTFCQNILIKTNCYLQIGRTNPHS
jgi:hypothetical protein